MSYFLTSKAIPRAWREVPRQHAIHRASNSPYEQVSAGCSEILARPFACTPPPVAEQSPRVWGDQ